MSSRPTWRLIPFLEASGAKQMAIDRWLWQQHCTGQHPPTLRFYTWSPAAISLGYHQRHWPDHWRSLTWQGQGIDLVRRPTGGRAVLHQGDLTYGFITSYGNGNRLESYHYCCQFLLAGWRSLGVELTYGTARRGYIGNTDCFSSATGADLVTASGYKLIGSAQLRKQHVILQHGSMRLQPCSTLHQTVFGSVDHLERPIESPPGLATLAITTIVQALIEAAASCYHIDLIEQPLNDHEWQEMQTFRREKPLPVL